MRIRCRCSTIVKLSLIFLSFFALITVWKNYETDDFSKEIIQDVFDREMISLQDIRKKQTKKYCAKHGNKVSLDDLELSNIMVLEKYKLLYCPISKVASTTWETLLGKLEGADIVPGSVHRHLKKTMKFLGQYSPKERDKMLKSFTKFMFVREPFERLLSAYRNCFWGWKRNDPWWKKFRYEVRKFLVKIGERSINLSADNTTFEEFLTYVVEMWKQGGNNNLEWHFRPQFGQCHPCLIQYDIIGHYETLQDDSMFVLKTTKLLDKVSLPKWRSTKTRALMHQYYSTMSPLRFSQLKNIYKEDIEAFGFTNIPRLKS